MEKKSVDIGLRRLREGARPNRLRAFLREFGARLCYWGQPRPPSTLLWLCVPTRSRPSRSLPRSTLSFSFPLSPSLSSSLRHPLLHRPTSFAPTEISSVTILLYFPAALRHLSFFRSRCRLPSPSPFSLQVSAVASFFLFLRGAECGVSLYLVLVTLSVYPFHLSAVSLSSSPSRSFIATPFPP